MHTNRLIQSSSPYLLQHAHNPVDWHEWGEDAFRKAREEDKPIFLSAGYSTCHWCHVMERESFEDERIAAMLNEHFVPVKLDREERPDVDRVYMLFVQATTGSGGWPMSVWMTPELKPFYGGTYFPPETRYGRPGFAQVLEKLAEAWKERRERLVESAGAILGELERHAAAAARGQAGEAAIESCYQQLRRTFDAEWGGFGGAPKFPRPAALDFLFEYFRRTGKEDAREMALVTLRKMAEGGMHDQLGGGFHRYSVDERWMTPHFEKMLYDQAQLASTYLEAYEITREEEYARVARGIFEYVLRDMTHERGGFFSAEDADSAVSAERPEEKEEGAFYTWSGEVLTAEAVRRLPPGGREKLIEERAKRVRPHLDDKILASWNAMMVSALAKGARVLREPRYLAAALRASEFVFAEMWDRETGRLKRRWRNGQAAIEGFLDDYAAMIEAQADLFESTRDAAHKERAQALAAKMCELFEDKEGGGFFATAGGGELVLRLKDDYDGAEPSGNSMAVSALLRVEGHREAVARALEAFASKMNEQAVTLPRMLCGLMAFRG